MYSGKERYQYSFSALISEKNINISVMNNYIGYMELIGNEVVSNLDIEKGVQIPLQKRIYMYRVSFPHNPLYCVDIPRLINLISRHEWPLFLGSGLGT